MLNQFCIKTWLYKLILKGMFIIVFKSNSHQHSTTFHHTFAKFYCKFWYIYLINLYLYSFFFITIFTLSFFLSILCLFYDFSLSLFHWSCHWSKAICLIVRVVPFPPLSRAWSRFRMPAPASRAGSTASSNPKQQLTS